MCSGIGRIGACKNKRTFVLRVAALSCMVAYLVSLKMEGAFLGAMKHLGLGFWGEQASRERNGPLSQTRAELYAEWLLDNKQDAVGHLFNDSAYEEPSNMFWLHVQKTGTSLFNAIYLHFCPEVRLSISLGETRALNDNYLTRNYPQVDWCPHHIRYLNWPRVGYHWPYRETDSKGRPLPNFTTFAMLRDPIQRVKSAYAFGRMHSRLNDTNISLLTYFSEPQIPNCQMKNILGHSCRNNFVNESELNVTLALTRIASPTFFFGVTDRWAESMCLFHKWYGGSVQKYEHFNNRPTKRRESNGTSTSDLKDLDTALFAGAVKIFEARLRKAGCANSTAVL